MRCLAVPMGMGFLYEFRSKNTRLRSGLNPQVCAASFAPLPAADAAPPTAEMPPQPRAPSSPAFTSSEVGFGLIKVERMTCLKSGLAM